tara:strand:- start:255 stop:386 length:132 start_codon:yes stop_codon:yes gene_type:complete
MIKGVFKVGELIEKLQQFLSDETEDWFLSEKSYEEYFNEEEAS